MNSIICMNRQNRDKLWELVGFLVQGKAKISVDWTRTQIKYKGQNG